MRLLHMVFPFKNKRAVKAPTLAQLGKVGEEFGEAHDAVSRWHIGLDTEVHACEELLDLMLASEALFCKFPEDAQKEAVRRVIEKGAERGDWV